MFARNPEGNADWRVEELFDEIDSFGFEWGSYRVYRENGELRIDISMEDLVEFLEGREANLTEQYDEDLRE